MGKSMRQCAKDKSQLFMQDIPALTHSTLTAAPRDHFEVTIRLPVTIQNPNFNGLTSCRIGLHGDFNYQTTEGFKSAIDGTIIIGVL
jgi:hypothetical protein